MRSHLSATEPGNNYFTWLKSPERSKSKALEEGTYWRICLAQEASPFMLHLHERGERRSTGLAHSFQSRDDIC